MNTTNLDKAGFCMTMPDLERLQFYYGRNLTVADLQSEQQYFLEKLRLHARCFYGVGIVCGLGVRPVPVPQGCESEDERHRHEVARQLRGIEAKLTLLEQEQGAEAQRKQLAGEQENLQREYARWRCDHPHDQCPAVNVSVDCGWALDCEGREIIVRADQVVDLRSLLSREDRREIEKAERGDCSTRPIVELTICYCEQQTYPSRPITRDNCDLPQNCRYGRIREGYRWRASLTHQAPDTRCSNCCEPCAQACIVLAHIAWPLEGPILEADIDWRARREVSVYQAATIDGISWAHGAHYDSDGAKTVLGTRRSGGPRSDGIEVHFSKPVYAETLQPGVVDLWRVQGGRGLAGVISQIEGSYVDKPETGLIDSFRFRDDSGETLNHGDRVLIQVRGNFILDACCKPLDGEHIGGLVPQLALYQNAPAPSCKPPRAPCADRPQPWTSGNGRPGATFESWFFIDA
ncbi:hypothetical protein F2P45_11470 [Massilia sp. CCM 8733]|uniref:Uncharacterized protein n=1 Tax=Massilia mucilaginosa TaxID=2609282 RepID=A0ABX0NS63_9BURK|nr:hypothetical protein [Massilia mucilaginosa]NHZ89627.1 hypothetical protein [Massilia mucilaginosa]